jgi:MoaA/NifB/PqqE/SkfB family radical SAM enzyme
MTSNNLKNYSLKKISEMASLIFYEDKHHGHWIYEKLHRPASYFHAMINLLYHAVGTPKLHRVLSIGVGWSNLDYPGTGPVQERPHFMDINIFYKLIQEMPSSVEVLVFSGLGEPLLHPHLFEMIECGAKAGLRVIMYTNGISLYGEVLERLAASSVAVVNISLEPDSESLKKYRGVESEMLSKNIKEFYRKKKPGIELKFSLVVHAGNYNRIARAYKDWSAFSDGFKIARKVSYDKKVGCTGCLEPWLGNPMILSNGDVSICCHTFGAPIVIGNVAKKPFYEIINNKKHKEILTSLLKGQNVPDICNYCSQFEPDRPFFKFLKK